MTAVEFAQNWGGIIGTVAGVLLGAVVAGGAELLRRRLERKRAIATALADLLEARHHAKAASAVLTALRRRMHVPNEILPLARAFMDQLLPDATDMNARYNAAVTQLAGIDPLLAFEMRAKDTLPSMLRTMRAKMAEHQMPADAAELLENALLSTSLPAIEDALRLLAKEHSRKTSKEMNSFLQQAGESDAFSKAVDQMLGSFVSRTT